MWAFFQDQILGMKWLNILIGKLLFAFGLDINGKVGGTLQFFVYDTIKIVLLLCSLIFIISYIQSYFPPENQKDSFSCQRATSEYTCSTSGDCDTFLFLFFNSTFHRLHWCRAPSGRYIFFFDLVSYGGSRVSSSLNEYIWNKSCCFVCSVGTCDCCCWRNSNRKITHGKPGGRVYQECKEYRCTTRRADKT